MCVLLVMGQNTVLLLLVIQTRTLSYCSILVIHYVICRISGFVDIFSKTKDRLGSHASKILKFLHRNRIPSSAIPFPVLEGYSSLCTMRSSVVQSYLDFLLQKEKGMESLTLNVLS